MMQVRHTDAVFLALSTLRGHPEQWDYEPRNRWQTRHGWEYSSNIVFSSRRVER